MQGSLQNGLLRAMALQQPQAVCMTDATHSLCSLLQGSKKEGRLALARQLIGNNDEVTDVRLIGPPEAPTHLALATNSPAVRVFDIQTLNCTATLAGHTDTVLVLDALCLKGTLLKSNPDLTLPSIDRFYRSLGACCIS